MKIACTRNGFCMPFVRSSLSCEKGSMDPFRCMKMTAYLFSRKHSTLLLPREPVLKLSMKRTCHHKQAGENACEGYMHLTTWLAVQQAAHPYTAHFQSIRASNSDNRSLFVMRFEACHKQDGDRSSLNRGTHSVLFERNRCAAARYEHNIRVWALWPKRMTLDKLLNLPADFFA